MRRLYMAGCAIGCLLATAVAHAAKPATKPVLQLDMHDPKCTIQAAGDAESKEHAVRYIALLNQQLVETRQWDVFMNSRKWKPGVAVGQQMTASEAKTFSKLQQQTKVGLLSTILEEKRSRDLRVFISGARVAKQMDLSRHIPSDEGSEDYTIATILEGSRDVFAIKEVDAVPLLSQTGKCSFERALIRGAGRFSDEAVSTATLNEAQATLDRLTAKYGSPINPGTLSPSDKAAFTRSASAVDNAKSRLHYYFDLLFLARLEQVSKLQRDVRRQSQIEAPGDVDHINVVWQSWRQQGRISDGQEELTRVLNYINEKIPTEFAKGAAKLPAPAGGGL